MLNVKLETDQVGSQVSKVVGHGKVLPISSRQKGSYNQDGSKAKNTKTSWEAMLMAPDGRIAIACNSSRLKSLILEIVQQGNWGAQL